ncbi:MAG: hypothetical protein Kow0062_23610 [Acidobacteriota bacterium]
MKHLPFRLPVILTAALIGGLAAVAADDSAVTYRVVPGTSHVRFDASSTLHGFDGESDKVRGEVRFVPAAPERGPQAWVEVEAGSLDTGIGARNRKMWRVLETDTHRTIRFELARVSDVKVDAGTGTIRARAGGTMTIRGQQRPFALDVVLEPTDGGGWRVTGSAPLDMTHYGIKPPRVMFMKVAPEVTVHVELVLEPVATGAEAS